MEEFGRKFYTICDTNEHDRNQSPLFEERFRQIYHYESPPKPSLSTRIKDGVTCDLKTFSKVFPIVKWLPECRKKDLVSDLIAGLTVAVMHIPQGMAYALLGAVPPIVGIYMAFFPVLVYIVLGTSHHVSMGTFAVVCMMVGKCVEMYARTSEDGAQEGTMHSPIEVATAVCFMVGVWQVILSILRLGALSVLLSQTLVSGFTTGAAVHVLTSQIKNLVGVKINRYSGPLKLVYTYIDLGKSLPQLNVAATILSVCFIIFLVLFNELVKPFIQKRCKKAIPLPIELVVVIIGTLLSQELHLKERYGVAVVNYVPTGLPYPAIPPLELLPNLVFDGLIIGIVAVSINLSMASIFAQKLGYEIDGNQEILASGVGNVFSSFFSCMPFAASLSRSLIQESVGGKTQLTSVVSALALVLVLLFVGPFFEPLPYCILSSIIVVALKGMFKQCGELPTIYRNSKVDGFVWIATFVSVVVLDIDYGLGIGLVASIISLLLRNQKSDVVTLGRVPNTHIYLDVNRFKKAVALQDILILQVVGGLHFANVHNVRKEVSTLFLRFRKTLPAGFVNTEKQSKCLTLILDLSCVPSIDPSAANALSGIYVDVKALCSNLLICGCQPSVYESLVVSLNFDGFPKSWIFHSLHDAVDYAKSLHRKRQSEGFNDYIPHFQT